MLVTKPFLGNGSSMAEQRVAVSAEGERDGSAGMRLWPGWTIRPPAPPPVVAVRLIQSCMDWEAHPCGCAHPEGGVSVRFRAQPSRLAAGAFHAGDLRSPPMNE